MSWSLNVLKKARTLLSKRESYIDFYRLNSSKDYAAKPVTAQAKCDKGKLLAQDHTVSGGTAKTPAGSPGPSHLPLTANLFPFSNGIGYKIQYA